MKKTVIFLSFYCSWVTASADERMPLLRSESAPVAHVLLPSPRPTAPKKSLEISPSAKRISDKINLIATGLLSYGYGNIPQHLNEHEAAILNARWIDKNPEAALLNLAAKAADEGWPQAEREAIDVFIQRYQEDNASLLYRYFGI